MVFTREDAARAAQNIGIDFKKEAFQLEDLLNGMNTELARHGTKAGTADVTHDDPTMTAKLAVANLRVSPSYYTYTAGSKASAIVKDLLNIFGLEVGTMELAVDKEYPRGKVCKGKVKNVLTEIVTSDCKSRFLIRNGIVTINDPKTGTKTGYVLSAESGLLQAAEATDRTETTTRQTTVKDGKEKQEVTYKRECLLNYHLAPADVVKIKSDTLNGNHLIKGGQHTGCPDGDWKTTIEVKPV